MEKGVNPLMLKRLKDRSMGLDPRKEGGEGEENLCNF